MKPIRLGMFALIFVLGAALAAPDFAGAVPPDEPVSPKPAPQSSKDKKSGKKKKKDKQSEHQFRDGYRHAYNLIFEKKDYDGGIVALRALRQDHHSDVATLVGYASRKLGRYDDAKYWYDKALAANPNNERTLSYMGMWHAEQGNRLKALDYLAKVQSICGNTSCRAYAELKAVIAGTATY